uniref:Uncharacterized protein n=1 Tax=Rangifer tarandus platyrhynchus TaxID=3082113 RepID=A0ACB0FDY5_RANTA|nr:unnamed protein product [Rangifer tarandus platyrhynchus]
MDSPVSPSSSSLSPVSRATAVTRTQGQCAHSRSWPAGPCGGASRPSGRVRPRASDPGLDASQTLGSSPEAPGLASPRWARARRGPWLGTHVTSSDGEGAALRTTRAGPFTKGALLQRGLGKPQSDDNVQCSWDARPVQSSALGALERMQQAVSGIPAHPPHPGGDVLRPVLFTSEKFLGCRRDKMLHGVRVVHDLGRFGSAVNCRLCPPTSQGCRDGSQGGRLSIQCLVHHVAVKVGLEKEENREGEAENSFVSLGQKEGDQDYSPRFPLVAFLLAEQVLCGPSRLPSLEEDERSLMCKAQEI